MISLIYGIERSKTKSDRAKPKSDRPRSLTIELRLLEEEEKGGESLSELQWGTHFGGCGVAHMKRCDPII